MEFAETVEFGQTVYFYHNIIGHEFTGYKLSEIGYELSGNSYWGIVISYQLLFTRDWLSEISYELSEIRYQGIVIRD